MGNFKYKLKEITPENTPDGIKVGDIKTGSGVKTTVTDIDSETGAVSWDVKYVPNIEKLVDDVNDLTKTAKEVAVKTKEDSKFLDIYEKSKELRNIIRTHVRNQYPEEYKKIMEIDLDEMSMSGGGGAGASFTPGTGAQYATPFAFKLKKKQTDEGVGATLGLGPSASEDGVKDNAYVKQFKYKLVPKTNKEHIVQKGSGLEVNNYLKKKNFPNRLKVTNKKEC
jgi:hypothetical protein